ncbi:F-box protein SKIP22 [Camellia lanceoleosa]|uniref:F-box protein SKIP22 n=1 Tax=Camellia lanceoleosa TaxID=1840588 RepID=A0ACC0FTZ2_9ERIC|nr:F-box protein SKIP22 [Camellia lanceoleosa]
MKLRLRSSETKETLKIEVPTPCSIQHLKEVVAQRLPSSSSSATASVHLSLNRKDELLGSSPQDSLQALGITAGDLIFFTLDPNCISSETLIVQSNSSQSQNCQKALTLEPSSQKERNLIPRRKKP